jgi:hypothetical protein
MAEATKQAERTMKAWTDSQVKVWESWFDTIQSSTTGRSGVWEQVRKTTLDSLEKSVVNTLDAQAELSRVLVDSLSSMWARVDDAGDKARLTEIENVTKTATQAQKQLWSSWFDMIRKVDTTQFASGWEKALDAWQDAVRKAIETQVQWYDLQASTSSAKPTSRAGT